MLATSSELTREMRAALEALLDVLDPAQRAELSAPFDTPDHRTWTYLPGRRPGLAMADLDERQREVAWALVATGLGASGARTARGVTELDDVLRELEQDRGRSGWRRRGSGLYWLRLLGRPGGKEPWAWRLNGHHLALHLTVAGETVAGTPQFFGANPAVVPSGPQAGLQLLAAEEGIARQLLSTLDEAQHRIAVVATQPPSDILTRDDPVADPTRVPAGIRHDQLGPDQRPLLEQLLRVYVDRLAPPLAGAAWDELADAGLGQVSFGWAGATTSGQGHYYALRGPTFLVEYDNVQDNANHVHTVWRDLHHDWGGDALAAHYRQVPH